MADGHRMLGRDLVQIADVERPLVLELRVVEEVPLDPRARRRLTRLCSKLVDDARDRDEFYLERITDEHFIEERASTGVVVTVGEARDDRHLLCIEGLRAFPDEASD